jgi:hypothetical protein
MTDIKITKKDLINSINIHYLKKGQLCQNLYKLSKKKLLEIYNDNNIDYVSTEQLKQEIVSVEQYNYLRDIIHCNFITYENIPYNVINSITSDTTNEELEKIVKTYKLMDNNNFKNIKEFVFEVYKSYNNYCEKSNIKNECKYITLPSLKLAFNKI